MSTQIEDRIKKLNQERTWATELTAAVGQFLDKAQNANCPKLTGSCHELITRGLAMISHHTKLIMELRAGLNLNQETKNCATVKGVRK